MESKIAHILMIGLGGALGAISRYQIGNYVHNLLDKHNFPYGTLAVNIAGCFLIGLIGGISEGRGLFQANAKALLIIGFLGGFTTFSAFGYDTIKLLSAGSYINAAINVSFSVFFGLGAVIAGLFISKAIG